ncbi:MAG: hypothetical protein KatS3mg111_1520 [Pirellulaceae bacterium]|nr:MAG: hypothetical protein KatS3mg111_1520 [Pirellulaceae bacterium]
MLLLLPPLLLVTVVLHASVAGGESLDLHLRYQSPVAPGTDRFHTQTREEQWAAEQTAVIVCDMWDSHTSVNAVRRVIELAPHIHRFCTELRERGVTIIHAPSSCMAAYEGHPARLRAVHTPAADAFPPHIGAWCDQIPAEERAAYPLDQSDGGWDDDPEERSRWHQRLQADGRDPRAPWQRQTPLIPIDADRDYISDDGREIWSILHHRGIDNVLLVGVHTNMCVLGRPFGLRRLASNGKNVALVRDLTDTMYDPRDWPYCSHFTGTDRIVDHIERHVCPTITSNQVLGGSPFRFRDDRRLHLVMLIAEDEYGTEETLPDFAARHLGQHFRVTTLYGSQQERHRIVGSQAIDEADVLLISIRRRALPEEDLERIRRFVAAGKPMIGIRTASHAFSLRGQEPPPGHAVWETFDPDVWGGHYAGHHANDLTCRVVPGEGDALEHPIVKAAQVAGFPAGGSLYRVSPLEPGAGVLAWGMAAGVDPQPVAWTFVRRDGGRSFYTSLGHPRDFDTAEFPALLAAAIHWTAGLPLPTAEEVAAQHARYASGRGRQR